MINSGAFIKYLTEKKLVSNPQGLATNRGKYFPPSSDGQFSAILQKKYNPDVYFGLMQLIAGFFQKNSYFRTLRLIFDHGSEKLTDTAIYRRIKPHLAVSNHSAHSAGAYVDKIKEYAEVKEYLDFGCGSCEFADVMSKRLNIRGYATDIEDVFEPSWASTRNSMDIEFKYIKDDKIPFQKKFDLITCIMVLHHIPPKKVNGYITQLFEKLRPGGILLIREHDAVDAIDKMLCDIEHSLFIIASGEDMKSVFKQKNNYLSRLEWRFLLESAGFEQLYEQYGANPLKLRIKPNRSYIAIFRRPAS